MNCNKIYISKEYLQLKPTLCGGQSFRWKNIKNDEWIGVFQNSVWILNQSDSYISFKCISKSKNVEKNNLSEIDGLSDFINSKDVLHSYLRLNVDLNNYYKIWSESDPHFKKAAPQLHGVRILNQEVTENLFSFICSSNNNIKRISSMVEKLCEFYGDYITELDGKKFYGFPKLENLADSSVESNLRKAGFGYRAKFIYQSACLIKELGGTNWLNNLKTLPYELSKMELMKLPGVGAKVADCICLMSLGHMEAIPVDTHIFKVASEIYLPHLKKYKNLNNKIYNEIGNHFRCLHGNYAGWANTVLFCSDLKIFQTSKTKKKINK
ncbi:8-oxoguanine DNA glycosylase, putative [Pediculus humanus corporis]|uniref:N-glycosylase/DNA lyase n=1 Tax=Pediculus humanus subsp. corporis TaxID=121224 RepID=E0VWU9_PEDHC|nr:8-oxoguanine DNA glycosylase, putative [Pediculus humanus corporis]EEB17855.1 8-oxoguanine DNA glycosylase, putative [Pediculus humanus corporis]